MDWKYTLVTKAVTAFDYAKKKLIAHSIYKNWEAAAGDFMGYVDSMLHGYSVENKDDENDELNTVLVATGHDDDGELVEITGYILKLYADMDEE